MTCIAYHSSMKYIYIHSNTFSCEEPVCSWSSLKRLIGRTGCSYLAATLMSVDVSRRDCKEQSAKGSHCYCNLIFMKCRSKKTLASVAPIPIQVKLSPTETDFRRLRNCGWDKPRNWNNNRSITFPSQPKTFQTVSIAAHDFTLQLHYVYYDYVFFREQ